MTAPDNSSTPLGMAGSAMHEMFMSLQTAGFSHDDALKLIQGVLSDIVQAAANAPDQTEE